MPNSLLWCVGRGYSDLCGAMCAAGLTAIEYQIWKEVDGIFTADPRKVPSARVLATVTAEEAAELTFFGSEVRSKKQYIPASETGTWVLTLLGLFTQVIHPLTMEQLCKSGIVLRLKNVLSPSGSGTVIYPETGPQVKETVQERPTGVSFMLSNGYHGKSQSRRRPTAITSKDGLTLINVACNRITRSQSFLTSVFSQLERKGIVPDLVTTSERHVSLAIQAPSDFVVGNRIVRDLQKLGSVSICPFSTLCSRSIIAHRRKQVTILENMNIVSVIGQRMRNMVGTASKSCLQMLQYVEGKQSTDVKFKTRYFRHWHPQKSIFT